MATVQWPLTAIGQSQRSETRQPKVDDTKSADVEHLIDQLASRNPEPPQWKQQSPQAVAREEQIWKAVDRLHEMGLRAFPQLIAHFDDKRFCCLEDSMASDDVHHRSVGFVCWIIVRSQVKKYVPWEGPDPRGLPGYASCTLPSDKKEAESWWKANQTKSLWELQIENVRTVIAENENALKTEKKAYRRKLCEEAIRANERLAADIAKRRSPIPTEPFRPYSGK